MKRILILVVLLGLMALTTVAVQASGADVEHVSEWYDETNSNCWEYPWAVPPYKSCYESWRAGHRVSQRVQTPSGNAKYQFVDDFTTTYRYWREHLYTGDILYAHGSSSEGKLHDHHLFKSGDEHVFHLNDKGVYENEYEICTFKSVLQVVDGVWHTEKFDDECLPK